MSRTVAHANGTVRAGILAGLIAGRSGAREIATRSRMSMRTVARAIAALKRDGYRILSVREGGRWRYEVREKPQRSGGDPAMKIVAIGESRRGDLSQRHDDYLYGGKIA